MDEFLRDEGLMGCLNQQHVTFRKSVTCNNDDLGTGLFATKDFDKVKEDDMIVTFPRWICINAQIIHEYAVTHKLVIPALLECLNGLDDDNQTDERRIIMVFLLHQRFCLGFNDAIEKQNQSVGKWHAYVNALPTQFDTPVFFEEDSLEFRSLAGTGVDASTSAKLTKLRKEFAALKPHLERLNSERHSVSFEDFLWADAIIWSRVLSFRSQTSGQAEDSPDFHLVPLLDFSNHSQTPQLRWEITKDTIQLVCTKHAENSQFIKAGEELFISYGDKPNSELIFIHGFSLPNNTNDVVSFRVPIIEANISEDAEEIQNAVGFKMDLIHSLELAPVVELQHTQPTNLEDLLAPHSLLVALIGVTMAEDDGLFAALVEQRSSEDEWCAETALRIFKSSAMFDVLCLRVWSVVQNLVNERLAELGASEAETKGSESNSPQRLKFVRILRAGHKKILEHALESLSALVGTYHIKPTVQEYLSNQ